MMTMMMADIGPMRVPTGMMMLFSVRLEDRAGPCPERGRWPAAVEDKCWKGWIFGWKQTNRSAHIYTDTDTDTDRVRNVT